MLETINFLEWEFEADSAATMQAHALRTAGYPELCNCAFCRSFIAARKLIYPEQFVELLTKLGIPKDYESLVYTYGEVEPRLFSYEGWFHFIGRVVKGPEIGIHFDDVNGHTINNFKIAFKSKPSDLNLVPESFPDTNITQIEFSTFTPWILDEPLTTLTKTRRKDPRWSGWKRWNEYWPNV